MREQLREGSKKRICPGSEKINASLQRKQFFKENGITITDWLYMNSFDRQKKKQDEIKKVIDSEKKRRTPQLTGKARKAQP